MAAGASQCPAQQTAHSLGGTICRAAKLVPTGDILDGRSAEACWLPAQWVSCSISQPWAGDLQVSCCTTCCQPVSHCPAQQESDMGVGDKQARQAPCRAATSVSGCTTMEPGI